MEIFGFDTSAFKVTELVRPPGTIVPLTCVISCADTGTVAFGFVEVMNTGREALDAGGILMSN